MVDRSASVVPCTGRTNSHPLLHDVLKINSGVRVIATRLSKKFEDLYKPIVSKEIKEQQQKVNLERKKHEEKRKKEQEKRKKSEAKAATAERKRQNQQMKKAKPKKNSSGRRRSGGGGGGDLYEERLANERYEVELMKKKLQLEMARISQMTNTMQSMVGGDGMNMQHMPQMGDMSGTLSLLGWCRCWLLWPLVVVVCCHHWRTSDLLTPLLFFLPHFLQPSTWTPVVMVVGRHEKRNRKRKTNEK